MSQYMECLKTSGYNSHSCREKAKHYLECRMDRCVVYSGCDIAVQPTQSWLHRTSCAVQCARVMARSAGSLGSSRLSVYICV